MKHILMLFIILSLLVLPVSAMEFTAPEVPDSGRTYMPDDTENFGEGLLYIIRRGIAAMEPDFVQCANDCGRIIAVVLLLSLTADFSGSVKKTAEIAGSITVAGLLLHSTKTLIQLGSMTIAEISEYGKLLLPVMTAALAAQGGVTSSATLYASTALFNAVLGTLISKVMIPIVYIYLALAIAKSALGENVIKKIQDFFKWLVTWSLKKIIYIFTGYISITGIVSGSTDAAALKTAKMAVTRMVPVVGGILSNASEAIVVGAGMMKNAVGIYGLLAIAAMWIGPFFKIGIQYLLLKLTAAVCGIFDNRQMSKLIQDFSTAMGLILGMTGAICLIMLISGICYMRGVG